MFNIGDEVVFVNDKYGNTEGQIGNRVVPIKTKYVGETFKVVDHFFGGVYISKDGRKDTSFSAFYWRLEPANFSLENE